MIWKIFFAITAFFVLYVNVQGYNSDYITLSTMQNLACILFGINTVFVLGIMYSLGWKQQLFSKKSGNVFFALFITGILLFPVLCAIFAYPDIYAQVQQNSVAAIIGSVIGASILAVLVNIISIPLYVGQYKYKKNFDSLAVVEKPYWKLFSLYLIIVSISFVLAALTKYSHFSSYNFIDYFAIISCIYEIIFMIGFAWNVRIFNKLFWQITAILYSILVIITPFFISDVFNQDFHYKDIISGEPVLIILTIIQTGAYLYMVNKYAYFNQEKPVTQVAENNGRE